jgi:hypothetical protein
MNKKQLTYNNLMTAGRVMLDIEKSIGKNNVLYKTALNEWKRIQKDYEKIDKKSK